MKSLEIGIIYLLSNNPFYAHFIMQMRRIPHKNDPKLPTAGVCVRDSVELHYNPDFLDACLEVGGAKAVAAVLMHEAQHLTHFHITGRQKGRYAKTFNIAADCAINQFNPWLMESKLGKAMEMVSGPLPADAVRNEDTERGVVTINTVRKLAQRPELVERERMDYYYDALLEQFKKNAEKNPGQGEPDQMIGEGEGGFDSHEMWDESDANADAVKETIKHAANKAANTTGRGRCPGEVLAAIQEMNKDRVSWKSVLRNFVANSIDVVFEPTRKKRNRRYGLAYSGIRKDPILHLIVIKDTSGSVSDEALGASDSEIRKIHKNSVKITVIDADTEVQQVYEYNPKKVTGSRGRGGTTFSPALKKAEEIGADAIIFFTDGYGEGPENIYKPKGIPILWALFDENGRKQLPAKDKKIIVTP